MQAVFTTYVVRATDVLTGCENTASILIENDPYSIVENEMVKPGKGQAFNRVRLRNLKTGKIWEKTFKSGEVLEGADIEDRDMQYLYNDGEFYHFMDPKTFEQIGADTTAVGDATTAAIAVAWLLLLLAVATTR